MKNAKLYITSTISPMMISHSNFKLTIEEIPIQEIKNELKAINEGFVKSRCIDTIGAVSHENTAQIIQPIINTYMPNATDITLFNRININLTLFDNVLAIIPDFRATESREFTLEEVQSAGFRVFWAYINTRQK